MERMEDMTNVKSLYSPKFEHDNCGIGAVVNIKGKKSHDTVANALTIVETLEHRAGKDAEGKTGDGVGILLQISHKFFKKIAAAELGITLGEERDYAVGMFFFPQNELARNQAKKMFEIIAEKEGLEILGWRVVPAKPEVLGKRAASSSVQRALKRVLTLTASYMLQDVCSSSRMRTPTLYHFQAEL